MVKYVLLALFLIVVCCALSPRPALAPVIWPERPKDAPQVRVILDSAAGEALETLADSTRRTRREQAACVTIYGYLPTANNSRVVAILEIGPARPYFSDSLSIGLADSAARLCRLDEPVVHTHVVRNEMWGRPSPFDSLRAYTVMPFAPFNVLVSVDSVRPSKVTVYGMR